MVDYEISRKRVHEDGCDTASNAKHIKLLYDTEDTKRLIETLQARNTKLEQENRELKRQLTVATAKVAANEQELFELRPPAPFRFMDLPGELRNRVYFFVLPYNEVIKMKRRSGILGCSDKPRFHFTYFNYVRNNLLCASNKVGNEAFEILLKYNTIEVEPTIDIFDFLTKDELKLVRDLTIQTEAYSYHSSEKQQLNNRFTEVYLPRIAEQWNVEHLTLGGFVDMEDRLWVDPETNELLTVDKFLELTHMAPLLNIRGLKSCKVSIYNRAHVKHSAGQFVHVTKEWREEVEKTLEQAMTKPVDT